MVINKRVARELLVWSSFKHPNILALVGFCLDEDTATAWLISPYETGGDVAKYIKEEQPNYARRLELVRPNTFPRSRAARGL